MDAANVVLNGIKLLYSVGASVVTRVDNSGNSDYVVGSEVGSAIIAILSYPGSSSRSEGICLEIQGLH